MPLQVAFSLPPGSRALSLEAGGEKRDPASEPTIDLRRDTELEYRFEVAQMG